MSSNYVYDSRGVLRGGCTICSCVGYNGGEDMKKCIDCGHPPGKHRNLLAAEPAKIATSSSSHTTHTNSLGVSHSSSSYGSAAVYSHPQPPSQSSQPYHHHHQVIQAPRLPLCLAPGCPNPVHCDFNLPESFRTFSYCSPQCRDSHLLPTERKKLTVELEDLKRVLQEVSAAGFNSSKLQSPRQQSSEHSTTQVSKPSKWTTSLGGGKKKEDQSIVQVECRKEKYKSFGALLSKSPHNSDKTFGFVIVGAAVKDSLAYSKLQDGKLRIFDVIEAVNDKLCSSLLIPSVDPQWCFDQHLDSQVDVKIRISRSIALPPISSTLDFAQRERFDFTHVVALRYSPMASIDEERPYGLTLSKATDTSKLILVEGISKDSSAFYSGVRLRDRIGLYAFASTDTIISEGYLVERKKLASVLHELRKAFTRKESVILLLL